MIAETRNVALLKIVLAVFAVVLVAATILVGVASWAPDWLRIAVAVAYVVVLTIALTRSSRDFRDQIFRQR